MAALGTLALAVPLAPPAHAVPRTTPGFFGSAALPPYAPAVDLMTLA
jgi:hypothetical protein